MGVFNNFPYANFHELNADWIIEQVRKVMDDWEEYKTDMDLWKLGVDDQLAEFQAWFDNLDVQDEVRTVMNELILSGEFIEITSPQIVSATEAWLAAHITPTTPAVDDTLSISGAAADAKVTGDRITDLKEDITDYADATHPHNLFKSIEYVDNAYIYPPSGALILEQPNYFATGYIPVTEGKTYRANKGRNLAWYDSSKTYISGVSGVAIQEGVTAPENAEYIRFSINKTTDGMTTPYLLYFADIDYYDTEIIFNVNIPEYVKTATEYKISGIQFPNNLVNVAKWNDNAYVITTNGNLAQEQLNYFATDYIPVTAGTEYKSNLGRNLAWYDSNKVYISGVSGAAIQEGVTAPENAAYIRFTVNKTTDGIVTPYLLYFTATADYSNITTIPGLKDGVWCVGKKINWAGDSIVDGPDFDEIVCDALGLIKNYEYGINGSTIALNGDGTDTRNALCVRYADMTNDADIVAISCGTNDWMYAWSPIGTIDDQDNGTSNTTFYGALKALCKGLIDKYPKKTIFFTTPIKRAQAFENGNGGTYTPDGIMTTPFSKNKYGLTLGDYADIIKEVCGYYSIPVLDMYRESLLNPNITSQQDMFDNVRTHPNVDGQKIMAHRVAGWITQLGYIIE